MLDEPREPAGGTHHVDRVRGVVEMHEVSFTYSSGTVPVLRDVSLSVQPGQTAGDRRSIRGGQVHAGGAGAASV